MKNRIVSILLCLCMALLLLPISGNITYSGATVMAGESAENVQPGDEKNDADRNTSKYISVEATEPPPAMPLTGENSITGIGNPVDPETSALCETVTLSDDSPYTADTGWYSDSETSFTLSTAAQLAGLAKLVNDGTESFKNRAITLGADIDLSGADWTPIGTATHPFRGSFDGNGKTISNMCMSNSSTSTKVAALFGGSTSANIANLAVNGSISTNAEYAAGIVGKANRTHVENCQSAVEINIAGDGFHSYYAGGIAAIMTGEIWTTIVDCANSGDISVTNADEAILGGIVGSLLNDRVYNSYNTGDVTASGSNYSALDAGGIAGRISENYGTSYIANCYSIGTATKRQTGGVLNASSSAPRPVADLQAGSVVNCYGYSDVSHSGSYYDSTGVQADKTAEELGALGDTLNAWINAPTITLQTSETSFAPWFTGETRNGGMPCFTPFFTLSVEGSGADGASNGAGDYAEGDIVTINAGIKSGYHFAGWTSSDGGTFDDAGCASTTFTMPDSGTTITANWARNRSVTKTYTLRFDANGGSAITAVSRTCGATIGLSNYIPTKEGFSFAGWYSDSDPADKLTSVTLMEDMTVCAKWRDTAPPFEDVTKNDWFYDDVVYVCENALMSGIGNSTFGPYLTTTRGMIVTILYRLEGEPTVTGACPFNDVRADSYYEDAIIWAAARIIVDGYGNNKFGPEDTVTREQLAAILYRYAQFKGYDVTKQAELSKFSDVDNISKYAAKALAWANAEEMVTGVGGNMLDPTGKATRAPVAATLHRFCENVAK